jgi:hypothetical protein
MSVSCVADDRGVLRSHTDLAAMIAGGRQLRATVVVEKQVVETPQDELRRALTRRSMS